MIISSRVPPAFNDFPIIDYLVARFTYLSRKQWQERISEGRILCNNKSSDKDTVVKTNDIVSYEMPEFIEPPADLNYKIVYEDKWFLGINKPGNLLVHHQGKSFKSNLIYHLRHIHDPPFAQAGVINRLDRETSGIVFVAKNREALRTMNKLVADRKIEKEYLAVVHGIPEPASGVVDFPIGRMRHSKIPYRFGVKGEKAKDAVTRYETVRHLGDEFSLIRLFPETGRTHQLRVHLAALGHIILGDKLYGMTDDEFIQWRKNPVNYQKKMIFPRQALHCSRMSFAHPYTGKECIVSAPLPDDMKKLLQYQ